MTQTLRAHPVSPSSWPITLTQFLGILLLSRVVLLALVYWVTGGHELSNDTFMHMDMVREPLAVLTYSQPGLEQHPPFLPFLETVLGYPLQTVLSDFLTLRIVMVAYEMLLGALFYMLLQRLYPAGRTIPVRLLAYVLLPMGWMTSVVMSQDDPIGTCTLLISLLLILSGYPAGALFAAGVGVVAGKLFIGLEVVTLLAFCRNSRPLRCAVAGFAPIVMVYGAMTLHRMAFGLPLPLVGFRPDPYFGTNFWMLLKVYGGINLHRVGPLSGLLALGFAAIPAAMAYRRGLGWQDRTEVVVALAASLMTFFGLFYHMNPEYFLIAMPLLLATARDRVDAVYCLLVAVVPWAGKFFQNAAYLSPQPDARLGKAAAYQLFVKVFHSSPEVWLAGNQAVFSVLVILVALRWGLRLRAGPIVGVTRLSAHGKA